jgi:glycoside/pentoside/hexuronide:cation symporter, GPH family
MTEDYHERSRLQAWRVFFIYVSALGLPWFYKLTLLPIFHDEVAGVRVVGPAVGLITMFFCLCPAFFCRENVPTSSQPPISFTKAWKYALKNRPFVILIGALFAVMLGPNLTAPMGLYINIYYVCDGDKEYASRVTGWIGTVSGAFGTLVTPLVTLLGTRYSKRAVLFCGEVMLIVGYLLLGPMMMPKYPYLQMLPSLLICPGYICIQVFISSLLADVCDYDELLNGRRQEGMFSAVFATILKAGIALVTLVSSFLIVMAGYQAGTSVSAQTIHNMRWLFFLVPPAFLVVAALLTRMFPLTEARAREIREQLSLRNSQSVTGDASW